MDHHQSLATKASERYLLGEMSEPERFDFEAHYFECEECAKDVCAGDAMVRGIKLVCAEDAASQPQTRVVAPAPAGRAGFGSLFDRLFGWLTPAALAPMTAALVLALVAGYQALVLIPGLRWAAESRAMAPLVLRAAARGEEQTVEIRRGEAMSIFSLDVNAADPGAPLVYEAAAAGGSSRISGSTTVPPPGSPLLVVMPHARLHQAGPWMLVLRTPQGAEIGRYPFTVKLN
jgi:putative zinc finger protein